MVENVKKARRSFFHYGGIGVFQGDLSPLSFRSVVEVWCCCMDVILSEELLSLFWGKWGKGPEVIKVGIKYSG